jgi:hypothetical protein
MDHFSRLSLDQLEQVLSCVPIKQRLTSCSLVSTTWCTAAARATTSIKVDVSTLSFERWLRSHTAAVQVTSISLTGSLPDGTDLDLPLAQLGNLKELQLESLPWKPGPGAEYTAAQPRAYLTAMRNRSSRQGLECLTALTRLQLTGSYVRLAGLSALSGLQELECDVRLKLEDEDVWVVHRYSSAPPDLRPRPPTAVEELVAALPELQGVTGLTLRQDMASKAVVSQLSTLQSLQRLQLDLAKTDRFAALPESLTQLRLAFKATGSLTASNAAGVQLAQLTALESLYLRNVAPLDFVLLAGMYDLRSLHLVACGLAAGGPQLQIVTCFTALTSLCIEGAASGPSATITAAEADALTSSSQLAELTLTGKSFQLQLQDYASLFPPRRQLQHLTQLDVSADLLSNPAAVRQAGRCCPNLKSLNLINASMTYFTPWEAVEAAAVADSLSVMSACGSCGWTTRGCSCLHLFGNCWARSPSSLPCTSPLGRFLPVRMPCTWQAARGCSVSASLLIGGPRMCGGWRCIPWYELCMHVCLLVLAHGPSTTRHLACHKPACCCLCAVLLPQAPPGQPANVWRQRPDWMVAMFVPG